MLEAALLNHNNHQVTYNLKSTAVESIETFITKSLSTNNILVDK